MDFLKKEDFYFDLPEELIAQKPAEKRDSSRMMSVSLSDDAIKHESFSDIVSYLKEGDVVVLNDAKVMPFRFFGYKETGGRVEITLVEEIKKGVWKALLNKKVKEYATLEIGEGLNCKVLPSQEMARILEFNVIEDADFYPLLEKVGKMPLPPYIKRKDNSLDEFDKERYQTVYSKSEGAAAAPTAGLHFTDELIGTLLKKGVRFVFLTLKVGMGTFIPLKDEYVKDHKIHTEEYFVPEETADIINEAVKNKSRVLCVGTTAARVLETVADDNGVIKSGSGKTSIYIYPPYKFKFVKCMLTNFHFPDSTLILMISALLGREKMLKYYNTAIEMKYRFFSYGDCMLITE